MKVYAGIGSRRASPQILNIIYDIGYKLASLGWVLRSGGADGCDTWFQHGVEEFAWDNSIVANTLQEIYIPWNGFNDNYVGAELENYQGIYYIENDPKADEIAQKYHPVYSRLSKNVKRLIIRNGYQVLGATLDDPVKFVLVWTPDGSLDGSSREAGGSGHALRIAIAHNIPVYNLARDDHFIKLTNWLKE